MKGISGKKNTVPFFKMSGTGNDFIIIDNRAGYVTGDEADLFARLSARRTGIGADGVILLEESRKAAVRMHYFNADGHRAEMCANGARCSAWLARREGFTNEDSFQIEADDGLHAVRLKNNQASLDMLRIGEFQPSPGIVREKELREGGVINTGVPHLVLFCDDLDSIPVAAWGAKYRAHKVFPAGTNVDFVQQIGDHRLAVRTYERGVEAETLSCGTGVTAAALVAHLRLGMTAPILITARGGDLTVDFTEDHSRITLTGPVNLVYRGEIDRNQSRETREEGTA